MEGKEARDPQAALSRWTMIASVAILVGLLASLADPAYEFIFSDLNLADDEGSVTITLRSFVQGEALYDDVYTQYGPGFYTIVGGAMELLGVGFDNDGARFVNLFFWLASTLLGGLVLLKLTRNLVIAAVGLAITFLILFTDAIEPLHPGAAIGCFLLAPRRRRRVPVPVADPGGDGRDRRHRRDPLLDQAQRRRLRRALDRARGGDHQRPGPGEARAHGRDLRSGS